MSPWLTVAADRLRRIALALLLCVSATIADAQPASLSGVSAAETAEAGSRVIAAVTLNGSDSGEAIWVMLVDGGFVIDGVDARRIGITLPGPATGPVRIDRVPGVTVRYDSGEGVLHIVQRLTGSRAQIVDLSGRGAYAAVDRPISSVMLRYDAFVRGDANGLQAAGFAEALATTGHLAVETTVALDSRTQPGRRSHAIRLDSRATLDIPQMRMRATIGDVISHSSSFTRAVRLGGAQLSSDYSQRPDLVTTPLPGVSSFAAVPSGIDVLVNGRTLHSAGVEAGDFSLTNIPVVSGRNSIGVLVRDSLGRQTLQQVAIYASPRLMARGFSETSITAGALRYGYGARSFDYRGGAFLARHRRGINDRLTIDVSAEAGEELIAANGEASMSVGGIGLLTVGAGASRAADPSLRRRTGGLWAAGFESFGRGFSFSASTVQVSRGYRDVASSAGQPLPRSRSTLMISHSSDRLGNFSIAAVQVTSRRQDNGFVTPRARLITGYYSRRLGRSLDAQLSYSRDFDQRGSDRLLLGVVASFGGGRSVASASAAVSGSRWDGEAAVQRSAFETGDVGYRASVARGTLDREAAGLTWLTSVAQIDAAAERVNGSVAGRLSASGALVFAGGEVHAARRIDGGFAIVDTAGVAGIGIALDNRPVGRTSASGRLLVTGLRPYERNRLTVDITTLPPTAALDSGEREVRPGHRAGVFAPMGVRDTLTVAIQLVDSAGAPVAVGSTVTAPGIGTLVGRNGRVLLETPRSARAGTALRLAVTLADGRRCAAQLIVPADTPPFADLGRMTCVSDAGRSPQIASATSP